MSTSETTDSAAAGESREAQPTPLERSPAERPLSRLHPATLLIEIPGALRGFVLPLLIVLVFTGSWDRVGRSLLYALGFVGLGIVFTLLRYFTLRFGVRGENLVIQSGLFVRSLRTIPLDQIQNVDVRRGLVHRWLKVCEVRVETAGSSDAEAEFSVVSERVATVLREELLERRAPSRSEPSEAGADAPAAEEVLRAASLRDLAVAGATETRVGAFLAFLFAMGENLREGGFDLREWFDARFAAILGEGPLATAFVFATLVLVFLVVGWTASIVLTIVRWYGFKLLATPLGLRRRFGLLTQFEALVRRERIQLVMLEANPVRRAIGHASMKVQTAGSVADHESSGSTVLMPMLPTAEIDGLLRHVFAGSSFDDGKLERVHPKALRRGFVRASLRLFAFGVVPIAYATNTVGAGIAAVFALLFAAWIAWARYRALGYAVFDDYLVARAGVWTRRWWIVPKDRVQTLVMTRDPMQRVSGLATLVIDTAGAAGHSVARIVDLDVDRARSIFDDLLQNAARTSWGGGLVRPPRRNAVPA